MTGSSDVPQPEVLVTGLGWLGGVGARSLSVVLGELIAGALDSLDITAYSITPGADEMLSAVEARVAAGVAARLVIDDLDDQSQALRTQLRDMAMRHGDRVRIWTFPHESQQDGLHAKVVVADRIRALVGSANLSFRGLTSAHELGVLVQGPAARKTAECIDRLILSPKTRLWT